MSASQTRPDDLDARIEWYLDRSGLRRLNELHPLSMVVECMGNLAPLIIDEDWQTLHLLEHAAVTCLKAARIKGASKFVERSIREARAAKASARESRGAITKEIEPWPEPVDAGDLLDDLCSAIRRHVVLDDLEKLAVALWILHTHCFDAAEYAPRLAVLSPTKRCGKTTLMKVVWHLVRRPLSASNISTAALFRVIEQETPTLLIDEADTFLAENEQLRGVLNAGHDRQGGGVVRCDVSERGHAVMQFRVWGPIAIAMIGTLHPTLADRAISIRLRRKKNSDRVERFRRAQAGKLRLLARKCARWAIDNVGTLSRCVELEQLDDRANDNWEPLIAIAESAGEAWLQKATHAADGLNSRARASERANDRAERLLADIQQLITERRIPDRITLKRLAALLQSIDESPWASNYVRAGLGTHELGQMLRTFEIEPRPIRFNAAQRELGGNENPVARGYERRQFEDAFSRYLHRSQVTPVTAAESNANAHSTAASHDADATAAGPAQRVNGYGVVTDVTAPPDSIRVELRGGTHDFS